MRTETKNHRLDYAVREPGLRRTTAFTHAGSSLSKLLGVLGQKGASRDVEGRVAGLNAKETIPGQQEVSS